jgi:hypothetical protein
MLPAEGFCVAVRVVDGPPGGRFLTGTQAQKYLGVAKDVFADLVAEHSSWLHRTVKPAGRFFWEDIYALAIIIRGQAKQSEEVEKE